MVYSAFIFCSIANFSEFSYRTKSRYCSHGVVHFFSKDIGNILRIGYNISYRRFVSGCKQTRREEVMDKMTDKERQDTKMAMLYELRLIFSNGEKKEYTTEEIVELLDKIAMAKEQ